MEIINHEKKRTDTTKEENNFYNNNNFYNEQEKCYICKEKFCMVKDDKNYISERKVKDHCHYIGKFRGAAHSICNLNYDVQKVNLIVLVIIWINISLFLYQLKNNLIIMMVKIKQLHTNLKLLIVLDLCQIHYQILLITIRNF